MLRFIDSALDKITTYKLVVYYLLGLLLVAVGLSFLGDMQFGPLDIVVSAAVLSAACWTVNAVFAWIFKVPRASDSWLITALILSLIITPQLNPQGITFLLAAAGLAMASKYLLTIRDVHIFNPAAIAVVLIALGPGQSASWWVGTGVLLPWVLVGGVLVARKIRRVQMVAIFLAVTLLATAVLTVLAGGDMVAGLQRAVVSSPVFFLGFVMLTEPLSSPGTRMAQWWYAALVGVLLPPQVHVRDFYSSPEISLVVGNIFTFIVEPKFRLHLKLRERSRLTPSSAEFVFALGKKPRYQPGQYMEWTLPHGGVDMRGNRRYFTLASSPTEPELRLGVKFHQPSSSYKKAMLAMGSGAPILAAHVAGDFTLPKDARRKLVFVAGGIGITPFRSMVKYLLDTNQRRDITLIYAVSNANEIAYRQIFETARQQLGINVVYVVADGQATGPSVRTGYVTAELVQSVVPDLAERTFYVSGSHQMVAAVRGSLSNLSVPAWRVKVDYFAGYA